MMSWLRAIFYPTDNTRDGTQIPTTPHLSSRMKHIKQEMAKNHLQFVRFEATDLHGVSRSKSIPAHFFQVSFTGRVMSECHFMTMSKQMILTALSYFLIIYTVIKAEKQ